MSALMDRPVLQLNASYEPLLIIPVRQALKLIVKGKAEVEVAHEDIKVWGDILCPSVVRLSRLAWVPMSRVRAERKNIYLRDGHRCQYCHKKFHPRDLTLDHVTPRAQGGPSTWENLVACCGPCNHLKADRTPEQAGLTMLRRPLPRSVHTSRHMMHLLGKQDPHWGKFLYC